MEESQPARYVKGQLFNINLSDLHPDPNQPRKSMDPQALDELTASIRQHGVLEPILFRQAADGALYVVAGERRFAAAQSAGMAAIPAIYVEGNHAEISLVENLLRQDLTAVEEAEALDRVMKDYSYKQEDLSRMIGKAMSTISEILSINRLPQGVRDECRGNRSISKNILIEIAKSKQQRGMLTLYNKYKTRLLSKQELKKQRTREKKTPLAAVLSAITGFSERMNRFDLTQLSDADKENLLAAINGLREVMEKKFFSTTASAEPEATAVAETQTSMKVKRARKAVVQKNAN